MWLGALCDGKEQTHTYNMYYVCMYRICNVFIDRISKKRQTGHWLYSLLFISWPSYFFIHAIGCYRKEQVRQWSNKKASDDIEVRLSVWTEALFFVLQVRPQKKG